MKTKTSKEEPGRQLQDAVLDDAKERARQLRTHEAGDRTDESFTPPHGDPERSHLHKEAGLRAERHTSGFLGELDGGGVRFGPPAPEPEPPEDPKNPASKPQGTIEDQVANMESEGQAQEPVEPQPTDPEGETLDQLAMNEADEAGSAFLEHDKILRRKK